MWDRCIIFRLGGHASNPPTHFRVGLLWINTPPFMSKKNIQKSRLYIVYGGMSELLKNAAPIRKMVNR